MTAETDGGRGGGEVEVTSGQGDPGTEVRGQPGTGVVQTTRHPSCEAHSEADSDTQQPHGSSARGGNYNAAGSGFKHHKLRSEM